MNKFSSWVLDIVIKDGEFNLEQENFSKPMWFVISATGLQNPFSTPQSCLGEKIMWNFPARLIINIVDLQISYLFLTLCTYDQNGRDVLGIARSRVGLRSFPIGNPKKLRVPLMNASNAAQIAMSINLIASLSPISNSTGVNAAVSPRLSPSVYHSH